MSVTLQQMLDSVTDAISAMVLFAQEAAANSAVMKNLAAGATGVASAVQYLVAQADGTVGLWQKLGSQEMAQRMKENNEELQKAVTGLLNACRGVAENPKNIEAKNAILEEGKAILKLMVGLIQYNDLYDVMVGLKQVNVAKDLLGQIFNDVFPADDFVVLIQTLSGVLDRRYKQTVDSRAKQWLKEAREELNELTVPLVTLVKKSWEDESYTPKIQIVLEPFAQTLDKCIKALKLSSKSPFDLTLLDKAIEGRSSDGDLDDIILNTASFADALSAVRKALADGDEFELDRAIRALERDINAQLDAAEDFANTLTDPVLKAALLQKIAAARQQLEDILKALTEEIPVALKTGDKSKVNRLLDQLEKLFNQVSEELALREVQKAAASIDKLLDEIPPAVDARDTVEARALNKDVQKEVARQGAMAKLIAENTEDEFRKKRILDDVKAMQGLTGDLSRATEDSLKGDAKARQHLDEVIAEMRRKNKDLVAAATLSTPQELLEIGAQIEAALQAAKKAAQAPAPDQAVISAALDDVGKHVARQTALAKDWAARLTDDPELQKAIVSAATLLGKEAAKLPANAASKDALIEGIGKTSKANRDLLGLAIESPDDELEVLQGKIAHDGEALKEAVRGKNVAEAAHAINDAKSDIAQFNLLADIMGAEIEDVKVKDQLAKVQHHLAAQAAALQPAAKEALRDYQLSMPKLEAAVGVVNSDVAQIVDLASAGSPEDQMIKNADTLGKLAKRTAHEAEKADVAKAAQKSKETARKVGKQNRLAKNVAGRCEAVMPAAARQIVDETGKLEGLRKKVEDAAGKVGKSPQDSGLNKELKEAVQAFKDQADLTAKLARDIKLGKAEAEARHREEMRLAEERRRREEEERERERQRRLAEANLPKGPVVKEIVEAVVAMQEITDKYKIDSSAAGSLLELANKLAIAFQQLASLAKTGTKKDLIMKAREIADLVKSIMRLIEDACAKCRDPILCQEMRDMGQVTLNYATQLKIICSVKANLILEEDADAAGALITCSRGLCGSVGELVKLSQIAKLKPK